MEIITPVFIREKRSEFPVQGKEGRDPTMEYLLIARESIWSYGTGRIAPTLYRPYNCLLRGLEQRDPPVALKPNANTSKENHTPVV